MWQCTHHYSLNRPFSTCANKDDPPDAKVNAILAPRLGGLNVVSDLAPIFPAEQPQPQSQPQQTQTQTPACPAGGGEPNVHDDDDAARRFSGELGLGIAVSGKEYPWVFAERPDGGAAGAVTITGQAPPGLGFPEGGRVYLVWELPNAVKWQFAGGVAEDVPPGATWTVASLRGTADDCAGKEEVGAEQHAPVDSAAPPAV